MENHQNMSNTILDNKWILRSIAKCLIKLLLEKDR